MLLRGLKTALLRNGLLPFSASRVLKREEAKRVPYTCSGCSTGTSVEASRAEGGQGSSRPVTLVFPRWMMHIPSQTASLSGNEDTSPKRHRTNPFGNAPDGRGPYSGCKYQAFLHDECRIASCVCSSIAALLDLRAGGKLHLDATLARGIYF